MSWATPPGARSRPCSFVQPRDHCTPGAPGCCAASVHGSAATCASTRRRGSGHRGPRPSSAPNFAVFHLRADYWRRHVGFASGVRNCRSKQEEAGRTPPVALGIMLDRHGDATALSGELTDLLLVVLALGLAAIVGALCGVLYARFSATRKPHGGVSHGPTDRPARPTARTRSPASASSAEHRVAGPSRDPDRGGAGWGAYAVPRNKKRGIRPRPVPPPPPPPPAYEDEPEDDDPALDFQPTQMMSFREAMSRHLPMAPGGEPELPALPAPPPEQWPVELTVEPLVEPPVARSVDPPFDPSVEGPAEQPPIELTPEDPFNQAPPQPTAAVPIQVTVKPADPTLPPLDQPEVEWRDVDAHLRIRLRPLRSTGVSGADGASAPAAPVVRSVTVVGIGVEANERVILASDGPLCETEAIALRDIDSCIDLETGTSIPDLWSWLKNRDQ